MKNSFMFLGLMICFGITSCASVGGAWNAGTEIVTGTVDSVVGGAATMLIQLQKMWTNRPMNYRKKTRPRESKYLFSIQN